MIAHGLFALHVAALLIPRGDCHKITTVKAHQGPEQLFCREAGQTKSAEYIAVGGTAKSGTPCCFPFKYKDQMHHNCTVQDHDKPWCYVGYSKLWGDCHRVTNTSAPDSQERVISELVQDSPERHFCKETGSVKSKEYVTVGGTAKDGTPCCFPFTYDSQTYSECTKNNSQLWCYVGYGNLWGNCQRVTPTPVPDSLSTPAPDSPESYFCNEVGSKKSKEYITTGGNVKDGTPCCFPFTYDGQIYHKCTRKDHDEHLPWCYVGYSNLWGNCQRVSLDSPEHYFCSDTNTTKSEEYFTVGGTAKDGTPCCFPFSYEGKTYNECVKKESDKPWCFVGYRSLWGVCQPTSYHLSFYSLNSFIS